MSNKHRAIFTTTVIPLRDGHRQTDRAFKAYRHGASPIQAGRFLSIAYPYPKYIIPDMPVPVNGGNK